MRRKNTWMTAAVLAALTGVVTPAFADHRGGGRSRSGHVAGGTAVRGGVAMARVAPRITVVPRVAVTPPYRFYRPYYAFRPRLSLGLGLWLGYPVAYPYYYGYPYPYAYAYPYPYPYPGPYSYPSYGYPAPPYGYPPPDSSAGYPPSGYPPAGTVGVQPGTEASGVSFEITPNMAGVYVDGNYVGTVATFGPISRPLTLTPGRHHIEVRAPGYQTMAFDADVTAGQVIPFQGTMQPLGP